jgi:type I site-specific restriction endonuclease
MEKSPQDLQQKGFEIVLNHLNLVPFGKDRFLFEMATGTGKTLTAASGSKRGLRSGNTKRVLFLVDRLELEDQAKKSFHPAAVR